MEQQFPPRRIDINQSPRTDVDSTDTFSVPRKRSSFRSKGHKRFELQPDTFTPSEPVPSTTKMSHISEQQQQQKQHQQQQQMQWRRSHKKQNCHTLYCNYCDVYDNSPHSTYRNSAPDAESETSTEIDEEHNIQRREATLSRFAPNRLPVLQQKQKKSHIRPAGSAQSSKTIHISKSFDFHQLPKTYDTSKRMETDSVDDRAEGYWRTIPIVRENAIQSTSQGRRILHPCR